MAEEAQDLTLRQTAEEQLAGRSVALLALGSFGRGELCPGSDIDIQFLVADGAHHHDAIQGCLHAWWDAGLKLGYATRTVAETVALAREDLKTATALLDARCIYGDTDLLQELTGTLREKLYDPDRLAPVQRAA